MNLNITQMLIPLSFALDYLEIDMRNDITNHNKRVAYIAGAIGKLCNLPDEEVADLYSYSLLHDNGITKAFLHNYAVANDQLDLKKLHCTEGEKNIMTFPFFKKRDNVILYHHERVDGNGLFNIPHEEVDLFSRIIHLADTAELLYSSGDNPKKINSKIKELNGIYFEQFLVDKFFQLSSNSDFWMSMDNLFIDKSLLREIPKVHICKSYKELINVCQVYVNIIDSKSSFTTNHSRGLTHKAAVISNYYGFTEEKTNKMIIAAQLHDLGKLVISNLILDKPGKLTKEEYNKIKYHTFYTRKALEGLNGFREITEWASNHHEKLDGSGYPFGYKAERLDFESRILTCLDIYQALTEERPHRIAMSHFDAVKILEEMALAGEIQHSIVLDIKEVFYDINHEQQ